MMHNHNCSSLGRELGRSWLSPSGVFASFLTSHTCVARTTKSLPLLDSFTEHLFHQPGGFQKYVVHIHDQRKTKPRLQAFPHQFCSWVSERSDCQQQDPHSASMTLKREKHFFFSFFRAEISGTSTRKLREQKGRMGQLNSGESTSCRCTT